MAKNQIDAESLVDNLQNAKFGLSIQNIVALVTVLSSLIAGWYTFTGRIDALEEVVQGFAETSDIEFDYLTTKIDSYEGVDLSDIKGDIAGLKGDVKSFNNAIKALDTKIEEFHGDPLAKFKK